jgi:alginate O-acetyltransferase complex protein AlgI
MVFCAPDFLFAFLPLVLLGYFLLPRRLGNAFLLAASLLFYAWGEKGWAFLMLGSIAFNYALVLLAEPLRRRGRQRGVMALAVAANLALLVAFKYANFLADNLNVLLGALGLPTVALEPVHLPVGISFFTFHALSYVVDVYRGRTPAQRNPIDFGLYITFFPQLVAGPIVRYGDIAGQFVRRSAGVADFAEGVRRFVLGLAKKMLLANTLGSCADGVFGLPAGQLPAGVAWLGAVCYLFQIYFDFSGYSDMAVGLARMFGFRFPENFAHPYVSASVTEFWRRWHISLSTWFRDYLYIPLGGSRHGLARTGRNLLTVFVLCGLWHGASWTFLIWGLYHGLFLVLERAGLGGLLERLPRPLRHGYALLVVLVGWVFFRAATLGGAVTFLTAMCGLGGADRTAPDVLWYMRPSVVLALAASVVCSLPLVPALGRLRDRLLGAFPAGARRGLVGGVCALAEVAGLAVLSLGSAAALAAGTYNPFIYFRF